ncbi:MAG: hypothetical protein HY743_14375 [Deltaproteobacteria bacterium]|nr:hypothetical protein [Deltaproteobacteria bacterium]
MHKWVLLLLTMALLAPGACMPDKKAQEELQKEIQGLKTEIKALQEKLAKLEAGQQEILSLLQKPPAPPAAGVAPPAAPEPLSVSQLIKDKERFMGTRVTVKGMPGTVLEHHQTMLMKAPEGMVEVYFGSLPDVKTVNRLTSTSLDQPLTVTGLVNPPGKGGGSLRIIAEAVEF